MRSVFSTLLICIALTGISLGAEPESERSQNVHTDSDLVAAEIDRSLNELLKKEDVTPAAIANDEDFLRRVYLDLNGTLPSPSDVTLFGLNSAPNKRSEIVDQLLDSNLFGEYWGNYWREVVMSRATEQRSRLAVPAFERWLTDQLNNNRAWDEVTRSLITATGRVDETGETALIFAHNGQPEELAAEISRIFMGIQMSCANCHNHPTDSWQREDFHQLAAFLPRISVRREDPDDQRSFAVRSLENRGRNRGNQQISSSEIFRRMDRNRDGQLAENEALGPLRQRFSQTLTEYDADKNGKLSISEYEQIVARINAAQPGRGQLEYYMPDLNNPASQGTLTQPVFFISEVKGPPLKTDSDDLTRRHALADFITSPSNTWFAKAFVNRIWGEMLGQGFYMPIDDMGPERIAMFEEVLDILANGFTATGYDVKWVYRTIANTSAYQRVSQAKPSDQYTPPFASAVCSRLSSDQIYASLEVVLGTSPTPSFRRGNRTGLMNRRAGNDFGKLLFNQTFGVDPSTPKDEIIGNVPQGLFMMNAPQIEQMIRGNGDTRLARILRKQADDSDALRELYLLVFSREPTQKEIEINRNYISQTNKREEAFEDIMWSLMNTTEFISKR